LSVTTKYTDDERCKDIILHTHQKEYKVKNHYVNVNSNPTASQQNKKIPFFSFIAGVIDTSDQPLLLNLCKFYKKFELAPMGFSYPGSDS
jgi:hypothetical protein